MPNCRLLPPMRAWLWWWRATNCLPSCTFSRSVLVRVQDFIEKAVAPVPWMDFLVSSRIPPLVVTRVSRPPTFLSNPLERRPQYFAGPSPYIGWIQPGA
ncbi:hypothetical protein TNCV_2974571 [Trichonephila clavipes]|nr:hypothetical protein TNCV_2974571 [Trichonephila clavipes]